MIGRCCLWFGVSVYATGISSDDVDALPCTRLVFVAVLFCRIVVHNLDGVDDCFIRGFTPVYDATGPRYLVFCPRSVTAGPDAELETHWSLWKLSFRVGGLDRSHWGAVDEEGHCAGSPVHGICVKSCLGIDVVF